MAMQYFAIPAGDGTDAGGNQAVMVPLNAGRWRRRSPGVWRLRKHLVQSLRAMRTMKRPVGRHRLRPEPDASSAVARAACFAVSRFLLPGAIRLSRLPR
jgi:hypothetical protein